MKWFDMNTQVFEHSKVKLMLKAIEQTATSVPVYKGVFDVYTMTGLIHLCLHFPHDINFQALYLLAFSGFFVYQTWFHLPNLLLILRNNYVGVIS